MRSPRERHPSREILDAASMKCLAEFEDHLMQACLSDSTIETYAGAARHFAVWLALGHCTWASIDDSVLRRFQSHHCKCPPPNYGHGCYKRKKSRSRPVMCGVIRFARFLEQSGRIPRRKIHEEGQRQLTAFLNHCAEQHYSAGSIRAYRSTVSHFLTWLHWCRLPLDVPAIPNRNGIDSNNGAPSSQPFESGLARVPCLASTAQECKRSHNSPLRA